MFRSRRHQTLGDLARSGRRALAFATLVALAFPGKATAAPDLRTALSTSAFTELVDELTTRLQTHYDIGDFGSNLYSCPLFGGKASADMRKVVFDVDLRKFTLTPTDGKLTATFLLTVEGTADLDVENLLCFGGSGSCDVDFEADKVAVIVEIIPRVEGGRVKLTSSGVFIDLQPVNFNVKVSGCSGLAQVIGIAYDLFKGKVVNTLRDKLETIAREELLEALETLLDNFSSVSGNAGDVRIVATTREILVDKLAIGVDMSVDATATKHGSCLGTPSSPGRLTASPPPEFKFRGEHIGVALSKALLHNLLVEFWRTGMFCITDGADPQFGGALAVRSPNPPRIALIEGDEARLEMIVPGVELQLSGDRPVTGTMDVRVELGLGIDLSSAVLLTDPQVTLHNVRVSTADEPTLDYAQLFARLLPPLVSQAIRDTVLLPRVLDTKGGVLDDHFIYISRAATHEEHILVYAVLTKLPENDSLAPETELVETPDGWASAATLLVASAVDDQSPSPLLRYRWRVDGGAWTDPALRGRRAFELAGGRHTVQVVAVDLNGNVDKTPASTTFQVDDKAPTLTITERPPEDVRDSQFVVKYEIADDQTPQAEIKVHVTFTRPVEHADPDEPTQMKDVVTQLDTLKLYALGPGLHILTLVAEDRVGNRSLPVQALFEALAIDVAPVELEPEPPLENDGCCAIQRGPKHGLLAALPGLMLLALHAFVRRRRRRGPAQRHRRAGRDRHLDRRRR